VFEDLLAGMRHQGVVRVVIFIGDAEGLGVDWITCLGLVFLCGMLLGAVNL
jgi:hypothetical protein